ncbi:hypothetical protein BSLG_010847 [Batrachochytrium salamandrivorans]|nr:hypothetical protein BSLG_010847 [Batrachochytrium salamandrivorans]
MYRFNYTRPHRSASFDNGVVIHEYAHGISNRLTGGPSTGGCLSTLEAGGMGEGWSDTMALIVLAKSSDTATTRSTMAQCGIYALGSLWSLVAKRGFSANLHDASQSAGNVVAMKIILGGMMIQPCNPTFLSARNAIILPMHPTTMVPQMRDHQAFAKRGLGARATRTRRNDFSITSGC